MISKSIWFQVWFGSLSTYTHDRYKLWGNTYDRYKTINEPILTCILGEYPTQSGPSIEQYETLSKDKRNIHFMRICSPTYLNLTSSQIPLVSPSIVDHSELNLVLNNPPNIVNHPLYYSVFITNHKNKIYNTKDILRKKNELILSVNDIHSLSGYHNIKLWLKENNMLNNSNCPFKKIIKAGGHLRSIELIQNGLADVAVIDIFVLLSYLREHDYECNGFRILPDGVLGPYHAPVITVSKEFVKKYCLNIEELKTMFVRAFVENKIVAQKLSKEMLIGGFAECDENKLEKLQQLLDRAGNNLIKLPHVNISKL